MKKKRRLLSIGHSYVVSLNRRLVNEMARLGKNEWEVTVAAPTFMRGDLRSITLELDAQDICHVEPVPVYFSEKIHVMFYGWRLHEILKQDWDLVHCWEEPYIFAGSQIAWWASNEAKLVYFTAQSYFKDYPLPFNWIERYSMNKAAGWLSCGQISFDALSSRKGYLLPQKIIPHGVDINHFYPSSESRQTIRRSLEWSGSEVPIIGYLGRLVPEKGLDLLMRVLDQLKTPWRALFVGTGSMESTLKVWAKRYPDQVRICTEVRHNDVPQYLNAMDMLVAPSQTMPNWREQFGRMLIEAFACGIPVIGSDSGEIPYVLENAGMVVGEKDESGWVAAISDLLENLSRRQALGQAGLEKAHALYSWSSVAQQHLDFFDELLEK
jgi:glycosyltransferase involved in cell wall biosynthesis